MTMIDAFLEKGQDNVYDIVIEDGDIKGICGLDTAILMTFLVDARADESEVTESSLRRGWLGNEQNDNPALDVGSKLWLVYQSRANQDTLNRAISYVKEGFQWMLDSKLIKGLTVTGTVVLDNIILNVTFVRFNDKVFKKQFKLWEDTELV